MGEFADKIRRIVEQGLPLTQGAHERAGVDIKDPKTWPPGSMMAFWSDQFFGLGLVVANRNGSIVVFWDERCHTPVCVYKCEELNPRVIRKVL